ncbi:hypothetical protein [Thiohalorhabdus methylotrophus]|uniref:EAL domain-containing protein n=1 Tax=Thiohalorhabdus methylotrophus TaxID=3242694 RepID=A0ABV4TZ48_9GAMM
MDKPFIQDLSWNAPSRTITDTLLRRSSMLDLRSNAEGVEEPNQEERVQAKGCVAGQGYLFGTRLPASSDIRTETAELRKPGSVRQVGEDGPWIPVRR